MKRRYRIGKRPEIAILPINRKSSDDDLVVGKISVNSDFSEKAENPPYLYKKTNKKVQKKKLLEKFKIEDFILVGIILMLLYKRDEPDSDENVCAEEPNKGFSLEGLKKMLPIDQLSENDVLLILMLYLLF